MGHTHAAAVLAMLAWINTIDCLATFRARFFDRACKNKTTSSKST